MGGRNEADGRSHRRVRDTPDGRLSIDCAAMKPMAEAIGEPNVRGQRSAPAQTGRNEADGRSHRRVSRISSKASSSVSRNEADGRSHRRGGDRCECSDWVCQAAMKPMAEAIGEVTNVDSRWLPATAPQ